MTPSAMKKNALALLDAALVEVEKADAAYTVAYTAVLTNRGDSTKVVDAYQAAGARRERATTVARAARALVKALE